MIRHSVNGFGPPFITSTLEGEGVPPKCRQKEERSNDSVSERGRGPKIQLQKSCMEDSITVMQQFNNCPKSENVCVAFRALTVLQELIIT